jgi:hypothetical protein
VGRRFNLTITPRSSKKGDGTSPRPGEGTSPMPASSEKHGTTTHTRKTNGTCPTANGNNRTSPTPASQEKHGTTTTHTRKTSEVGEGTLPHWIRAIVQQRRAPPPRPLTWRSATFANGVVPCYGMRLRGRSSGTEEWGPATSHHPLCLQLLSTGSHLSRLRMGFDKWQWKARTTRISHPANHPKQTLVHVRRPSHSRRSKIHEI